MTLVKVKAVGLSVCFSLFSGASPPLISTLECRMNEVLVATSGGSFRFLLQVLLGLVLF